MATKKRSTRSRSETKRQNVQEESNDGRDNRDSNRSRSSSSNRNDSSEFVSITKLFETKKNPDNLVGTCKEEYLDKLENLLVDARDQGKGISFFVFLQGKWGPNLSACLAREQQESSFNDGPRNRSNWRR